MILPARSLIKVLIMLTHEEVTTLASYAAEHGRSWKAKLRTEWMNATTVGVLQTLRNSWFGPSGLDKFSLTKALEIDAKREESRKYLLSILKPGSLVYTSNTHVYRSGMGAHIKAQVTTTDGIVNISGHVCELLGWKWCDDGSVDVGGCGMDRGFHLVYALSSELFRKNFMCIGEGCPANDHVNGDKNYKPHEHSDGGYALRHKWA